MSLDVIDIRAHRRQAAERSEAIGARDIRLLRDLAEDQLRYGQAEEALILLNLCQHLAPNDPDTVACLARAFVALEEWEAAETVLAAHRRLLRGRARRAGEALLDAVVAQARRRVADARAAFAEFLALRLPGALR